nr:hypothetical protein [Marseillevirus cajuinensis]
MSTCSEQVPKCWRCKKEFAPKPSFSWLCSACNEKSDKKACWKCRCKPFRLMPFEDEDICVPCYCGWVLSEFI